MKIIEGDILKQKKRVVWLIIFMLIITNLQGMSCYAALFEEDLEEDEIIISEDDSNFDNSSDSLVFTDLKVNARCAIALDGESKQILFEQNAYEIVPMASTTKILTALVAINYGNLDREVTVSKNAASIRGSKVGYSAGEVVTMKELIFGLMFKSGNDAAIAIAEDIGGSVEGFAEIMNDFAKGLGLMCSKFETPHGLDKPKHYSSAYDLAILTSTAMKNDLFREICGSKTIEKSKYNFSRDYQNINKILWKIPNANGVKTGYTGQAGKCLVSSVNHEGRDIIIVVLNCTDRWNQTEKIYNYVVDNYVFKEIGKKNLVESFGYINLGTIIQDKEFKYGFKEQNKIEVEVFNPIKDVNIGDILGEISITSDEREMLKSEVRCNKSLSKNNLLKILEEDEYTKMYFG